MTDLMSGRLAGWPAYSWLEVRGWASHAVIDEILMFQISKYPAHRANGHVAYTHVRVGRLGNPSVSRVCADEATDACQEQGASACLLIQVGKRFLPTRDTSFLQRYSTHSVGRRYVAPGGTKPDRHLIRPPLPPAGIVTQYMWARE